MKQITIGMYIITEAEIADLPAIQIQDSKNKTIEWETDDMQVAPFNRVIELEAENKSLKANIVDNNADFYNDSINRREDL